ncbi:MAG: molybdopterin molybdotransferase MoeA [Deltaproteobacteria bacterium]|nr:molybdopterin molybdotransferase MoeA [Deltaproteobacteria bacterium]
MPPYPDALQTILSHVQPLPTERVPLELALGRALASDAVSRALLPAVDNSAMDGYAVRSDDLKSASESKPVVLKIVERITAGDSPQSTLSAGQAARIMTGGALPPGADAVVMQEDVEVQGSSALFRESVDAGEYIRRAGEDIRPGDVAVRAGQALGASELALMASIGETHASVHRRPRVAILATGDELVDFGSNAPGKLVDSNSLALALRLRELGCDVTALGVARDEPAAIQARFEAAAGADVIVSSAGVSVGDKDFVKPVLKALGATLHIERVAIRPGKPLVFATRPGQLFFGLPGNPVSSRVTFEVFVRPALRALMGLTKPISTVPAVLSADFKKVAELTFFTRVRLERDGAKLLAVPMPKQGSNYLTSLVGADGLAILPAGVGQLAAGTPVDVMLL